MSKSFDIMFYDLTEEAQKKILKFKDIDDPSEVGWTYVPIATLVTTDEQEEKLDNVDDMSEIPQEGYDINPDDEGSDDFE